VCGYYIINQKMNIIEKYYIRKASLHVKDDFHKRMEDHDIDLMRKA